MVCVAARVSDGVATVQWAPKEHAKAIGGTGMDAAVDVAAGAADSSDQTGGGQGGGIKPGKNAPEPTHVTVFLRKAEDKYWVSVDARSGTVAYRGGTCYRADAGRVEISGLVAGAAYNVCVVARNEYGWGKKSKPAGVPAELPADLAGAQEAQGLRGRLKRLCCCRAKKGLHSREVEDCFRAARMRAAACTSAAASPASRFVDRVRAPRARDWIAAAANCSFSVCAIRLASGAFSSCSRVRSDSSVRVGLRRLLGETLAGAARSFSSPS